jgi:membrane protease YdiL (CAAX protease family)
VEGERSFTTRALSIVGFGPLAFAIATLGGGIWSGLLVTNLRNSPAVPWSVPVMALLLCLMCNRLVAPFMEEAGFRGYF